jgi:hypothetical protein
VDLTYGTSVPNSGGSGGLSRQKGPRGSAVHVKDYDVGLCIKWESLEAGKVYAPHILHQSFTKLYKPILSGLKVIDFYGN